MQSNIAHQLKSVFAQYDQHSTGLVYEDIIRKVLAVALSKLGYVNVSIDALMSIVAPHRSSTNPGMVRYILLVDALWPEPAVPAELSLEEVQEKMRQGLMAACEDGRFAEYVNDIAEAPLKAEAGDQKDAEIQAIQAKVRQSFEAMLDSYQGDQSKLQQYLLQC
eukprot:gnl/MRDRNA2_/MRDRNA2_114454_c0_seq1.p1 gnl/MRDRNA2_/MRDRNA2_114454_c0~~gnl/MRDRNA2_/MRDRNA2_114454_c0_seq1.p1  ORF type:complete len:164 (+),score=30.17 gnl/MRDRNA2_/MRDRNA2_114454_c0_seq1:91-582(+)